jgi:transcriptional regulator of acetoin/glycerol metabolism
MSRKSKTGLDPELRRLRTKFKVKPLRETVQLEVVHAMKVAKGDTILAAALLGIGKTTVYRKMELNRRGLW